MSRLTKVIDLALGIANDPKKRKALVLASTLVVGTLGGAAFAPWPLAADETLVGHAYGPITAACSGTPMGTEAIKAFLADRSKNHIQTQPFVFKRAVNGRLTGTMYKDVVGSRHKIDLTGYLGTVINLEAGQDTKSRVIRVSRIGDLNDTWIGTQLTLDCGLNVELRCPYAVTRPENAAAIGQEPLKSYLGEPCTLAVPTIVTNSEIGRTPADRTRSKPRA